jgi:drug/metabolite transporter (DMT)-like permease
LTTQRRATLYGLGAVLLWSTVATAFKLSLRHLTPAQLLFYAAATSLLFLGALAFARGEFTGLGRAPREQVRRVMLLGLINPFIYYLVLFEAYDRLPAQVAQPINFTWALTLGALSIPMLGQRFRPRLLLAGLVAYAGVLVISMQGGAVSDLRMVEPLGVALALGSTLLWALYWIGNTHNKLPPVAGLCLGFCAGLPPIALVCLLGDGLVPVDWRGLWGAAYVGVVEMGVAFVLWLTALKLADSAARVANLIFLAPFLSLLFIALILGERILPSTYIGLVLIVAGLMIQGRD